MKVKVAQVTALVAGVWLMAAPAALHYAGVPAADFHRTVGPVVTSIGTIAMWSATRDLRWLNVPLGLALTVAPLVVDHAPAALLNGVVTGLVLTATAPIGGADPARRGRGWAVLVRERGAE